jgi:mediator of RNA polymerase II transcription subunit 12
MWKTHTNLLCDVLTSRILPGENAERSQFSDIEQILLDNFSDIRRRNEAMLFHNLSLHKSTHVASAVTDIQVHLKLLPRSSSVNFYDSC